MVDYNESQKWIDAFKESLHNHIKYVRIAGNQLGVDFDLLDKHDDSKFSNDELFYYARQFQGDKKDPDGFARAWLHHIHNNPHHWQYWIFSDGHTPENTSVENGVVRMPNHYVLEMIADWMGASMAYTGSFDMTEWLWSHIKKITIHSESAKFLRKHLSWLGYDEVVAYSKFKNEL